jgi:Coenzyme PQQ synthesis protein D (PqqD)
MSAPDYPKQRNDIHTRVVDGETVILDRRQNLIHQLNHTATRVWDCCDGQTSLTEIALQLTEAFDVPQEIAVRDVTTVIQQFHDLHLLVV